MEKEIIISSRYHVKRKLGEGGMAKVYLAYDSNLELDVALKILKKENVDEKKINSFKREARTLSLLDDPNIVSIYDVGEENGIHYIANEFVEGMTLKEYISACSPIPVEEVVKITNQILLGLDHAHNKGVVHKDIKSQNILLDSKRNVKITDLGIADIIDEEITRTQSLMGTPQYVAPEILNRDELTAQSDIYSVGILMYEMLVGKAPFTGDKPAIIMIKQMNHPLPPIKEQRTDVPQVLENIAIKASAKKLENRYISAEEMRADLTRMEMGHIHEPKLILENDLIDDKKLEQTIILDTTRISDDLVSKKPKKTSKLRKMLLIIIVLLTLLLILSKLQAEPNLMPDFTGQSIEEIQSDELFVNHDFEIIYSYSADYDENMIVSTNPEEGEEITDEQAIFVTVSKGPKEKEIADYIGSKISVTKNELENLDYEVVVEEVDSLEESGTILNQDPAGGETIAYGSVINFEVSKGTITTEVPNFIGLSYMEAESWASEHGIVIEQNRICNESTMGKDTVYHQSPNYNTTITSGDTVQLDILDEPCALETPEEDESANDNSTDEENSVADQNEDDKSDSDDDSKVQDESIDSDEDEQTNDDDSANTDSDAESNVDEANKDSEASDAESNVDEASDDSAQETTDTEPEDDVDTSEEDTSEQANSEDNTGGNNG